MKFEVANLSPGECHLGKVTLYGTYLKRRHTVHDLMSFYAVTALWHAALIALTLTVIGVLIKRSQGASPEQIICWSSMNLGVLGFIAWLTDVGLESYSSSAPFIALLLVTCSTASFAVYFHWRKTYPDYGPEPEVYNYVIQGCILIIAIGLMVVYYTPWMMQGVEPTLLSKFMFNMGSVTLTVAVPMGGYFAAKVMGYGFPELARRCVYTK